MEQDVEMWGMCGGGVVMWSWCSCVEQVQACVEMGGILCAIFLNFINRTEAQKCQNELRFVQVLWMLKFP